MAGNENYDSPQTVIQKARDYESAGRGEIALLVLEGGVIKHPEAIILLEDYVDLAQSMFKNVSVEQSAQQLNLLSQFIHSRISFISIENIESVVALADKVRAAAELAIAALESAPSLTDTELTTLGSINNGSFTFIELSSLQENALTEVIVSFERLLEYATYREFNSQTIEVIQTLLEQARYTQQFNLGLFEVDKLLNSIATCDEQIAGYRLQQADQILRNFATDTSETASLQNDKLISAIKRLSKESDSVSAKIKSREAKVRFQAFEASFKADVEQLNAMATPINHTPSGLWQRKITAVQKSMQGLLELSTALSDTEYAPKLTAKFQDIQKKAVQYSNQQQTMYDQWAMSQIRAGYKAATEHIKRVTLDDEKKISKAIVDYFGPIDLRFLSPEVQRTYSEIFELVYARLNSTKKDADKDFNDKGGKLYTLNAMMTVPKLNLSYF